MYDKEHTTGNIQEQEGQSKHCLKTSKKASKVIESDSCTLTHVVLKSYCQNEFDRFWWSVVSFINLYIKDICPLQGLNTTS